MTAVVFGLFFVLFALITVFKTVKVVPQSQSYVIERLGRYSRTLNAGLHIIIPFMDRVAYVHSLKEIVKDIEEQVCFTRDNVQVAVDGILYFQVLDPARASYGVANFIQAIMQLSQTTLRSEIGQLDLDHTFEERGRINVAVVEEMDKATEPWGVKVIRYEIKTIKPPADVLASMEKQMRAEREKRAQILTSEGDRDSKINRAEGIKQETIRNSEAEKQKRINEAQGQAEAIMAVAQATSEGIRKIAEAINQPGGQEAVRMRIAEDYIKEFGNLAKTTNTMIVPASTSDVSSMVASAMSVMSQIRDKAKA